MCQVVQPCMTHTCHAPHVCTPNLQATVSMKVSMIPFVTPWVQKWLRSGMHIVNYKHYYQPTYALVLASHKRLTQGGDSIDSWSPQAWLWTGVGEQHEVCMFEFVLMWGNRHVDIASFLNGCQGGWPHGYWAKPILGREVYCYNVSEDTTRILLIHDCFLVIIFESVITYRIYDGAMMIWKWGANSMTIWIICRLP